MATFKFELISPQRILFEGEARSVSLPGAEGDMTAYPGHERLVTMINPGMIDAVDADGNAFRAFVSRGFAEITEVSVTVLGEVLIMEEDLSQAHIDEEIVRLQAEIEESTDETDRSTRRSLIMRLEQIRISGLR
ncbi:ATP synthase F1 subunit epsilon [Microbaculum sp. FT89]|uniref:ATP synthase F1 subunit epsilon n=1 Tax=Microbaculum sp. FT89 TaxID=3447298 RepID=UPI003F53879F